jgi:GNAT superfamily N-acetyltransferase
MIGRFDRYTTALALRARALLGDRRLAFRHFAHDATSGGADPTVRIAQRRNGQWRVDLVIGGQCVSHCTLWRGESYDAQRGWFALGEAEAELVLLATPPEHRGRGHASRLLRAAPSAAAGVGLERLGARVWHSNEASVRAFRNAGWDDHGIVWAREGARGLPLTRA